MTVDDLATAAEERDREIFLKAREANAPKPLAHGTCHQCFSPCPGAFCEDDDCRDQYERRMKMKQITGSR